MTIFFVKENNPKELFILHATDTNISLLSEICIFGASVRATRKSLENVVSQFYKVCKG